jgi:ectoine hydroxylase-related dioxygenase (phytanoyl-CoA dioxygenase family)
MDGILINIPTNYSRLYTWHSESHYYPIRNNFFNTWTPLLCDKNTSNGTMLIKKGSHKGNYTFNEFIGYEERDNHQKSAFHQLDVPDDEIEDYEVVEMNIKRNSLIIFNKNMIHRSTVNTSKKCSFAMVIRFFEYSKDLTLSHSHRIKPYTQEYINAGYPQLRKYHKN